MFGLTFAGTRKSDLTHSLSTEKNYSNANFFSAENKPQNIEKLLRTLPFQETTPSGISFIA